MGTRPWPDSNRPSLERESTHRRTATQGPPRVPTRPQPPSWRSFLQVTGRDGRDLNPGTTRVAGAAVPATPAAGPGASRSGGGRGSPGAQRADLAARAARSREHGERPLRGLRGLGGRQAGCPPPGSLARWLSWAPCPGRYLIKQRTGRQAGAQAEVPGRARQEEVCPTAGRGAVQSCH